MRSFLAHRRRNNHGSRCPSPADIAVAIGKVAAGVWIDPLDAPLKLVVYALYPRVSRSETATPTPLLRRWHWPELLAAARTP
jgi:hypothetical protein